LELHYLRTVSLMPSENLPLSENFLCLECGPRFATFWRKADQAESRSGSTEQTNFATAFFMEISSR
jgi:hypothetical protein